MRGRRRAEAENRWFSAPANAGGTDLGAAQVLRESWPSARRTSEPANAGDVGAQAAEVRPEEDREVGTGLSQRMTGFPSRRNSLLEARLGPRGGRRTWGSGRTLFSADRAEPRRLHRPSRGALAPAGLTAAGRVGTPSPPRCATFQRITRAESIVTKTGIVRTLLTCSCSPRSRDGEVDVQRQSEPIQRVGVLQPESGARRPAGGESPPQRPPTDRVGPASPEAQNRILLSTVTPASYPSSPTEARHIAGLLASPQSRLSRTSLRTKGDPQ
jgi:hypothetical protein